MAVMRQQVIFWQCDGRLAQTHGVWRWQLG